MNNIFWGVSCIFDNTVDTCLFRAQFAGIVFALNQVNIFESSPIYVCFVLNIIVVSSYTQKNHFFTSQNVLFAFCKHIQHV